MSTLDELVLAVQDGDAAQAGDLARAALDGGADVTALVERLSAGMREVGDHFGAGAGDAADELQREAQAARGAGAGVSRGPPAERCLAFGREIRKALEAWPENLRVAIIGTGSFPLEVFGPRINEGKTDSVPDPQWAADVCDYIEAGDIKTLLAKATEDRLHAAGNVGGELLNWIAMFAFTETRKPDFLLRQMEQGHAYAGWRLD